MLALVPPWAASGTLGELFGSLRGTPGLLGLALGTLFSALCEAPCPACFLLSSFLF